MEIVSAFGPENVEVEVVEVWMGTRVETGWSAGGGVGNGIWWTDTLAVDKVVVAVEVSLEAVDAFCDDIFLQCSTNS